MLVCQMVSRKELAMAVADPFRRACQRSRQRRRTERAPVASSREAQPEGGLESAESTPTVNRKKADSLALLRRALGLV
jgi:hypothetical protein